MTGKRFMNESMQYVEACRHMYGDEHGQGPGPGETIPAWLVFDQQSRDRYIFAGLQPGRRIPNKWLESGVIVTADTLEELAAKAGLPVDEFSATVKRFNDFARSGTDEDFHRGESAYDRYYGDRPPSPTGTSARSATRRTTRPGWCRATSAPRAASATTCMHARYATRLGDRGAVRCR